MAQEITAGESFENGQIVTHQRLNNHVNGAVIRSSFVSGKPTTMPETTDFLSFYDVSAAGLAKASIGNVVKAYAGDGTSAAAVAGLRILGTGPLHAAAGNDSRFPSTMTGIRKSSGAGSTDTAAVTSDFVQAPTAITLSGGVGSGNCALNTKFTAQLTASTACVINLINIPNGARIVLRTQQPGTPASGLTVNYYSDNAITLLSKVRPGGSGDITGGANAMDLILIERFGNSVCLRFVNNFS